MPTHIAKFFIVLPEGTNPQGRQSQTPIKMRSTPPSATLHKSGSPRPPLFAGSTRWLFQPVWPTHSLSPCQHIGRYFTVQGRWIKPPAACPYFASSGKTLAAMTSRRRIPERANSAVTGKAPPRSNRTKLRAPPSPAESTIESAICVTASVTAWEGTNWRAIRAAGKPWLRDRNGQRVRGLHGTKLGRRI